jgi:hypothetical protein
VNVEPFMRHVCQFNRKSHDETTTIRKIVSFGSSTTCISNLLQLTHGQHPSTSQLFVSGIHAPLLDELNEELKQRQ